MGKPISQVKRFSNEPKWEDEVDWIEFPDDKMVLIRVVGDVEVMARHWVTTPTNKRFPVWCPQLNENEDYDSKRWCPAHDDFADDPSVNRAQKLLIGNCIVRQLQERRELNPVRGFMIPHAAHEDLIAIAELIKADPADPERGVDLAVRYTPKAVGNRKWQIQRGESTPLTDEERRYRLFNFPSIIPNFADEEVANQYARSMKEAMARHKYYVVQEQRIPQGARDPFKYFRGDPRGQPWTQFAVLVDYRNQLKGENAQSYRVSGRQTDGTEQTIQDDVPPPPPPPQQPQRQQHHHSQQQTSADNSDVFGPPQNRPDATRFSKSPENLKMVEHPQHGQVPECFGKFNGTGRCITCDADIRDKCIEIDTNM